MTDADIVIGRSTPGSSSGTVAVPDGGVSVPVPLPVPVPPTRLGAAAGLGREREEVEGEAMIWGLWVRAGGWWRGRGCGEGLMSFGVGWRKLGFVKSRQTFGGSIG